MISLAYMCIMCYISTVNTTHIYTLAHPETGVIRYVGKANNLAHRFALHIRKDEVTAKSKWIQSLKKKGLMPQMEVLDIVPIQDWQFWEIYWIAQLKAWGYTLYNGDNGGLGSDRLPDSVKDQISNALKGRPQPDRWVQFNQYSLSGVLIASHKNAQYAGASVGGTHPNISRSAQNGKQAYGFIWTKGIDPPACIATQYDSNGRIPVSAEARQKLSVASKGRIGRLVTEVTRAKMRAARLGQAPENKGVKQTETQRAINRQSSTTKKAVVQLALDGTFIKIWPSIKEASEATGVARAGILNTITGKNKYAGGFRAC